MVVVVVAIIVVVVVFTLLAKANPSEPKVDPSEPNWIQAGSNTDPRPVSTAVPWLCVLAALFSPRDSLSCSPPQASFFLLRAAMPPKRGPTHIRAEFDRYRASGQQAPQDIMPPGHTLDWRT